MKPSEIIIKETHLKNQSRCTVILKGNEEVSVIGELAILVDKDRNYRGCGFGTCIDKIRFNKSEIYPMFCIEPDKYDDPNVLRNVRAAIAGAIVEYCTDKDPDKYSVIDIYDYTPEAEIDENGIKWRLSPTTKMIHKIITAERGISHLKRKMNKCTSPEGKVSLANIIKHLSRNNEDVPTIVEVPINSPDKDGDLYQFSDEDEETNSPIEQPSTPSSEENSPIPSREKLSIKSLSDEKEILCNPSQSSEISEKENVPVM